MYVAGFVSVGSEIFIHLQLSIKTTFKFVKVLQCGDNFIKDL